MKFNRASKKRAADGRESGVGPLLVVIVLSESSTSLDNNYWNNLTNDDDKDANSTAAK
jgi:hypothetical protein